MNSETGSRLLLVTYAFAPLTVAGAFRPTRFAKYLPRFGWNVDVLTVHPRPDVFHDSELLEEVPKSVTVHRTRRWSPRPGIRHKKRGEPRQGLDWETIVGLWRKVSTRLMRAVSVPDGMVFWVPFAVFKGLILHRSNRYDVILTTSPPHSCHLVGYVLSRLLRRPWVVDFRDPWVDHALWSKMRKGSAQARIERRLERAVMKRADRVIANTTANRDSLLARYPHLPEEKFVTITNGFDREYIEAIESKAFTKFTICHTGILYPQVNPYFFFEALKDWIAAREQQGYDLTKSFQVLLVGTREPIIERVVSMLKLKHYVRFVKRTSHRKALALAKGSDLLLLSLGFSDSAGRWVPLKLYDYFGCGKPILGLLPKDSLAARMIQKTDTGHVICQPDAAQVFAVLDQYYIGRPNGSADSSCQPDETELNRYEQARLVRDLSGLLNGLI